MYLDRNHLLYVKEKSRPADTYARFFLHVIPGDVSDLPADRRAHGFNNWDFGQGYWELDGRWCVAKGGCPSIPFDTSAPDSSSRMPKATTGIFGKVRIELQESYEDEGRIL